MANQDSGRIGKAVEHLVAATRMLRTRGQLNVSTALLDDEGVDLVFFRRDGSATLAVQVKARTTDAVTIADKGRFIGNLSASTYRPRSDLYLLFLVVDPETCGIGPYWWVPSLEFDPNVTSGGKRKFIASTKDGSNDQWSSYRRDEFLELPQLIIDQLELLEATSS